MLEPLYGYLIGWSIMLAMLAVILYQIRLAHASTKSKLDALLDVISKLARAEGYEAGRLDRLRYTSGKLDEHGQR